MTHAYQGSRSSFLRNLMVFAFALIIFGWAATDNARAADPNLWTVTGGSNGSKAEGSNESSKSVGASKASNTAIGTSTNSNPESGRANAAPASAGNVSMTLPELGAGRINIFQVTKGLVNNGNKPAMSGPGSDKNTAGKSSLAGSISSQEPAHSSVAKVPWQGQEGQGQEG